jgi:hypothetical protein
MAIINGKPVKAFLYQDHQAHIQVHMAAIQDPKIQQMIGQNPQAQAIQAAAMAHINEHIAFEYRRQIEEQLGVTLPDPEQQLPEEAEAQLAPLIAQAAQQLLTKNQGEVQQQQAQQQQQDPLIQMQQQELQIKQQEAQAKAQKMMADAQNDQAKLEIEKMRIESQERIAGAQLGVKAVAENKNLEVKQMIEGTKLGVKATSDTQNRKVQSEQIAAQREQADKQHKLSINQLMRQSSQKSDKPKEE